MAVTFDPFAWSRKMATEISRLPGTLRRARTTLRALDHLPTQLEALIAALDRTTTTLDGRFAELQDVMGRMDVRLEHLDGRTGELADRLGSLTSELSTSLGHLDGVVSALGENVTGVLGAIPGVRRAIKRTPPAQVQSDSEREVMRS